MTRVAIYNPNEGIFVTALGQIPPFYPAKSPRTDPLGALRELDAEVATRYGRTHCRVIGLDLNVGETNHRAPAILTTADEFVVDVNPPELPA